MQAGLSSRGLGDTVAKITSWFGIRPCGGCERRQDVLNRWVPYKSAPAVDAPAPEVSVRPAGPAVAALRIETVHKPSEVLVRPVEPLAVPEFEVFRGRPLRPLRPLVASSGGFREPGRMSGPFDWEGDRRQRGASKPGTAAQPGGPANPTSFACGIDVTAGIKAALQLTRTEFGKLDNDKKHEACSALSSLRTGGMAWDIIELHSQVTGDVLNKAFRPPCATSGATPKCGSSVAVDGSCHFAGSANYAVFGVMCRLCSDYYVKMYNDTAWYHIFDNDTYFHAAIQFSKPGMLGLVDLYKKYIPLLSFDAPAGNLDAAKRWSIAGYDGWPVSAPTPPADRGNCEVTCPYQSSSAFRVSWYPFLHPYPR